MFPVTLYISRRVRVRDNRRNRLHPPASLKYQNLSHEGPVERMRDGFRVASGMDDWLKATLSIRYYHYMMEAETAAQQTVIHISNPPNVAILLQSPDNILIL